MKAKAIIEPLEARIAPAKLVGQVLTYTDIDGDKVTVTISKALLAAGMFTFDTGFLDGDTTMPQQLQRIDLAFGGIAPSAGANITTKVTRAGLGDGLVNIGEIVDDDDLGSVTIKGDLGVISCGDQTTATGFGLKSLNVHSLGRFGTATGGRVNGDGTMESHIIGALGAVKIKGDLANTWLHVTGKGAGDELHGTIGSIAIGGSLIGGSTLRAGTIDITGDIGPVKIGHDIQGGTAMSAGSLQSDYGRITSVTLGGSLIGSSATFTGEIRGGSGLGPVKIAGNVQGGSGDVSGFIAGITGFGSAIGNLASLTVGGSVLGGAGRQSGQIQSPGDIGPVKIGGDVRGGSGDESAKIDAGGGVIPAGPATGRIASLTIAGSLTSGGGKYTTFTDGNNVSHFGQIFAVGDIGAVKIGRDVVAAAGVTYGGVIHSLAALGGSVTIGGSLGGGAQLLGDAAIGAVKIAHDANGFIFSGGKLTSVSIGGADGSGHISSSGPMGLVKIAGDLGSGGTIITGGTLAGLTIGGSLAGIVSSIGNAVAVKIGGDLFGSVSVGRLAGPGNVPPEIISKFTSVTVAGSVIGGAGNFSGVIFSTGDLGAVKIGHDLVGGSITSVIQIDSGLIESHDGRIGSVTVGGSIISGIDNSTNNSSGGDLLSNASIRAGDDIGSLTVKGSIIGNVAPNGSSPVIISARGQNPMSPKLTTTSDTAIGTISIGGRVEFTSILAGCNVNLSALNADAQIGAVKVAGDWIASSLAAGVKNSANTSIAFTHFGDGNDVKISGAGTKDTSDTTLISKIASIAIGGIVTGTTGPGDHFGFVAQQIGSFKAAGFNANLTSGTDPAIELAPATADVTVREI